MAQETAKQTSLPSRRSWALRIATAILLPVLLLGLIEGGLRLFGVGFPTTLTIPCAVQGRPAACYNLFFPAPFFPPGMIKTPQAYAIPAEKPKGTYRIFVLGESAAMGDPDPAYAFSRYLEVMLLQRYPAVKFEVVNTGSVAINSHVLLPIAKGLAKEQPDLFIIYSGNNEVVGPYGPGTALTSGGHEHAGDSLWHLGSLQSYWATAYEGGNAEARVGRHGDVSRQADPGEFSADERYVREFRTEPAGNGRSGAQVGREGARQHGGNEREGLWTVRVDASRRLRPG